MSYFDDASLVMIPSGYKDQKVYSVKPLDGTGDLTFSRASSATRVASSGLIEKVRTNIALYSEQFNDANWLKGTLTVSANAATAPNGTTTADLIYPSSNSSNCVIFNGVIITSGVEYTNSVYVKASGKTWTFIRGINDGVGAWFNLSTGVVGSVQSGVTATITSIGSGWYRCSVTQTSSSTTGRFVILIVDGDGSTAVTANGTDGLLIWGGQQETGVMTDYIATTSAAVSVGPVSGLPRLDYLNSSCPRLLLEPQRTNVALYSEQFNNAYWLNSGLSLSVNSATSPDGYVNADIATETATTSQHGLSSGVISFTSGTTYTFSVFAKNAPNGRGFIQLYGFQLGAAAANVFANFNLNTGAVGTATGGTSAITNYGNGWYRCTFTFTCGNSLSERINLFNVTSASATSGQSYVGDITKAIYWYGAQVEVGAYATSYIPTLGTSVTRVADAASKTGISSLIGQTEGTLFADVDLTLNGDSAGILAITGTGVSFIYLFTAANTNILNANVYLSGAAEANMTYTLPSAGRYKIAVGYKANDFVLYVNGVQRGSDNSGSVPACSDLYIDSTTYNIFPNSKHSQALLFKTRLTNAQLAELTTL